MVCSYGDQNDVALFRELQLEEVIAIGLDGRMTEAAGDYQGLKPKQARTKIIEDLENANLVEKIEEISHRTPLSERSKIPIEIVPMEEYYLKQKDSIEKMKKLGSEIEFYPNMHKQILMNWLESISIDWPISRRRFYGTEIPIWYCNECSEPFVPEPGKYYRPWKDSCPAQKCEKCGNTEFTGGGVARTASIRIIEEIMDHVTIPVMAKCRIGHMYEASVLDETNVDMIDESEVLTPADEYHHIWKWDYTTPFVDVQKEFFQ